MALNVPGYTLLRKANGVLKHIRNERRGLILTPSRRIARVAPPGERIVAMTFDDGPTKMPPSRGTIPDNGRVWTPAPTPEDAASPVGGGVHTAPPSPYTSSPPSPYTSSPPSPDSSGGAGLTEHLLSVLKEFGARGTFDVVGSTAENYPDAAGEPGGQYVFGKKYDHYAAFGLDDMAGAEACPDLIRRIAREGHELTNHTFRHIIYGKSRAMYSSRVTMSGLAEAVADLKRLHTLIYELTKIEMRFTRPPHYVDKMPDGHTSFDACEEMDYHYLSASFDGGGYLPSAASYTETVEAMVRPMREALEADPSCLAGQIIFQKDGYNMSKHTPIADALKLHLELLEKYGYRVITVSELVARSPFEDVRPAHDCFEAVRELDKAGFITGFRNNRFYPERAMTRGELNTVIATPVFNLTGDARPGNAGATGGSGSVKRHRAIKIDKKDQASVRQISARASEVFDRIEGQPASNKRGDVAVWLHKLAVLNGIC
ncbi:MAG: polysaccharide deacetylase family protein [Oscillospiraceae bacterium]|jgi:peptidoglycan/xylan/chitin deacetylase (PgdA/CDA1 family)|nr:polysaccharide deacetylase family protein [Oscillospiraceae bacterium]